MQCAGGVQQLLAPIREVRGMRLAVQDDHWRPDPAVGVAQFGECRGRAVGGRGGITCGHRLVW